MLGLYFSGTGNTKYIVDKFLSFYGGSNRSASIEDADIDSIIEQENDIVLAYPVYYSNLPKIMRDFVNDRAELWRNKSIFIIATMGLFSGDGAGISARILKKHGALIKGGVHIQMPDCISDVKLLKKSFSENKEIVEKALNKARCAAESLRNGLPPQEGLGILYRMAGLFGQRLWYMGKTKKYSDKLRIDKTVCIGCGKCASLCPTNTISIDNGKPDCGNRCTMCYRCVNSCPVDAITLLGDKVISHFDISQIDNNR